MKSWRTGMWMVLSAAVMGVAGCDIFVTGHDHREARGEYLQPQYVEAQPQYVVVQEAPPALIVETRPPPPSGLHVWIDGSWNWSNQRYNWQAGHYALPPQRGAVWVAPRYERDSHGYRYTAGQWTNQDRGNGRDHDGR